MSRLDKRREESEPAALIPHDDISTLKQLKYGGHTEEYQGEIISSPIIKTGSCITRGCQEQGALSADEVEQVDTSVPMKVTSEADVIESLYKGSLTISGAAMISGTDRWAIQEAIEDGSLLGLKPPGTLQWRIPEQALRCWLAADGRT